MGLFDFFKRKKEPSPKDNLQNKSKDEIYQMIFQGMAQESPSRHFVAGTVFDFARQNRSAIEYALKSGDLLRVQMLFINGYLKYLNDPRSMGGIPGIVDKEKNDTDPRGWNLSVKTLRNGDQAILLYMPIENARLSARIVGIVFGGRGDGYYYCMLNKDENMQSEVVRNKAMAGIETVGAVKGRGFELMESFVDCIRRDYYA